MPSLIGVDSGVSASIFYVSCAICYNKPAQTVAEMVEHLAVDHRMSVCIHCRIVNHSGPFIIFLLGVES